jgi:hypothetical protein
MIWLSSVFRIIGGGDTVLTAIALVMVADVFSEDERYYASSFAFEISLTYADQLPSFVFNPVFFSQRSWLLH